MTRPSVEASPNEVWGKAFPKLDEALRYYDKLDSLPEKAWLGSTKSSCTKDIEDMIDAVLIVLKASDAVNSRDAIKALQQEMSQSLERKALARSFRLAAPPRSSLSI